MYSGYITRLKNLRSHSNADRLLVGECFGNTVIINKSYTEGQLGVYFPTDGQLSEAFAQKNDLVRRKDENGNSVGGLLDPNKRKISAITLRGERSDGLFLPIECLSSFCDISKLKEDQKIDVLNGVEICRKYVPRGGNRRRGGSSSGNGANNKPKRDLAPQFKEHINTPQLQYNLNLIPVGTTVEVTLKMHGTSQRTGYLPVFKGYNYSQGDNIYNATIARWFKKKKHHGAPIYEYDYVSGTRRTVIENFTIGNENSFYKSHEFRKQHHDAFVGKLEKGETVYYEIVGFTNTGTSIMSSCDNKKMNDKSFVKKYGKTTTFHYGCKDNESKLFVYRMTHTDEKTNVVTEYSPEYVRMRCKAIGVETVPVLGKFIVKNSKHLLHMAEILADGEDPVGLTHIREGCVIRIVDDAVSQFRVFKFKNFAFKVLEGIIKELAIEPDMEEAEDNAE